MGASSQDCPGATVVRHTPGASVLRSFPLREDARCDVVSELPMFSVPELECMRIPSAPAGYQRLPRSAAVRTAEGG